jgi:hypothetical protein
MQILPALLEAYNRSGNPGRFQRRMPPNHDWFDRVPTAAADGPQMPILDRLMTFDSSASANAVFSLTAFCDELSRRSGRQVRFHGLGGMGSSLLQQGSSYTRKISLPKKFCATCSGKSAQRSNGAFYTTRQQ